MIRQAEPRDREAIQHLYEVLCPGEPVHVLAERIDQIRRDPRSYLLIADEDGAVIATAFLTICLDPMFGTQPYGVVENAVVDDRARGRGIGSELFRHIEATCRKLDCSKIMLLSNSKRARAHTFFSKMGFSGTVSKGFKKYLGEHAARLMPNSAE